MYGSSSILKAYLQDGRPEGACTLSYGNPSNHSAFSGSLALLLYYFGKRMRSPLYLALAVVYPICNGIARVGLLYHFEYQVFNGFIFGVVFTAPLLYVFSKIDKKEKCD